MANASYDDDFQVSTCNNLPGKRHGKRKASAMQEHAEEHRARSRQAYDNLEFDFGAPSQEPIVKAILNTFHIFRRDVLKEDIKSPFTAETLERFVTTLIAESKSGSSHLPGINVSTIMTAVYVVRGYALWTFVVTIDVADRHRIRTIIDRAVQRKQLVTGFSYERKWVGLADVSRLVRSYLEFASDDGTYNWDRVAVCCLSVTLLSATGARCGDIALSKGYKEECLRWRDVEIYWTKGVEQTFDNLTCTLHLNHTKGRKYNKNTAVTMTTTPLRGTHLLHVDPIVWLFVLALRTGNVKATTMSEILTDLSDHNDLQVRWLHPDRPVLPAFKRHQSKLFTMRVDQPARAELMRATVLVMADAAGTVGRVGLHDIRRGTARDLSRLPSRSGMDIHDIGAVLGHSVRSTEEGVTSRYVGPKNPNHFSERAYAEPVLDPLALRYAALEQEPESSATAVQAVQAAKVIKGISTQKRRVEQTHHNVESEARGVTVSDDVWRKPSPLPPAPSIWWITDKGQLGVAHTRLTLDTLPPNSIDDRRLLKISEDSQEGDEPVSDEEEQTDDDEETVVSNNKNAGTMANWLEGLAEETIEDDYSEEQNTLLAALDDDTFEVSTEALMQCITANNSLEVEQLQAIIINTEASQHSPYHTHVQYVDAFARCNVLAHHAMAVTVDTLSNATGLGIEPPEDLPFGNARNHPTPQAFRCRVSKTCNYATVWREVRIMHEKICKAD